MKISWGCHYGDGISEGKNLGKQWVKVTDSVCLNSDSEELG